MATIAVLAERLIPLSQVALNVVFNLPEPQEGTAATGHPMAKGAIAYPIPECLSRRGDLRGVLVRMAPAGRLYLRCLLQTARRRRNSRCGVPGDNGLSHSHCVSLTSDSRIMDCP